MCFGKRTFQRNQKYMSSNFDDGYFRARFHEDPNTIQSVVENLRSTGYLFARKFNEELTPDRLELFPSS